jgi:uncharacterized protein (TIGR03437 family)
MNARTNVVGFLLFLFAAPNIGLVAAAEAAPAGLATTTTVVASPSSIATTASTALTATVTASSGSVTPSGTISFNLGNTVLGVATLMGTGGAAQATLPVNGSQFAVGLNGVGAFYSGDATYTGSGASVSVMIASTAQATAITWTQEFPAALPSGATGPAMTYDAARGQILLFGGFDSNRTGSETWTWDGTNWTHRNPSHNPPGRFWAAMAYDAAHGQAVLFGGTNITTGNYMNDTWVWNGTDWAQVFPATSPPTRQNHAMVYDASHGLVVMTGGIPGTLVPLPLMDTWVWDGTNWSQLLPATSPPRRDGHAVAYDAARGRVVLFGGEDFFGSSTYNDTWVWDGTNWKQSAPLTSPPARTFHALAFDATGGYTLLFGGKTVNAPQSSDTWTWDGANWTQLSSPTSPPARYYDSLAYDSAQSQSLLFGGEGACAGGQCRDTWTAGRAFASPVVLGISKAHAGNFNQAQTGATYTVTVSNAASSGPTAGTLTVADNVPTGLTLVSMSGTGWTCTLSTCTRSDALNPGSSYPPITVTVNVASNAPSQVTNQATVAGGGSPLATASDVTTILASAPTGPVITAAQNGASFLTGFAPNSWLTIKGSNLASVASDTWQNSIVNGQLPVSLDGVSVTVGGLPAYIYFVSPGQINAVAPNVAAGATTVVVKNSLGTSAAFSATVQTYSPAFFQWPGGYAVATHQDFSDAARNGALTGVTTVPAKPGEVIILWATGFGPTTPATPVGLQVPASSYPTSSAVSVTVGGTPATVYGAALAPGFAALFQVAIQIPPSLADGDYAVVATVNGVSSPSSALISVQSSTSNGTGSLQIQISGLPSGTAANVAVTSAAGFSTVLAASQNLQVPAGTYSITANSIPAANVYYAAFPAQRTASVTAGSTTTVQVSYNAAILQTVQPLGTQTQGLAVSSDGSTVSVAAGSQAASALSPGNVLAIGITPTTPNGLLRKVVSVSQIGSLVTAQTSQATLTDVFQDADFTFQTTITTQNSHALQALRPGVTIRSGGPLSSIDRAASPRDTSPGQCATPVLVEMISTPIVTDPNGTITVTGQIQVCPSFEFDWHISGFSLQSLTATATLGESVHLSLDANYHTAFDNKVPIGTITGDPVIAEVGFVPIVLTPSVTFFVGVSGEVNASFSVGVTQAASVTGGVSYANGGFSPVFQPTESFTPDPVAVGANVTAKAYAGYTLDLTVEGVLSPEFTPDSYLQFDADITKNPWWTLSGGTEGGVGLKLAIFGHDLKDYEKDDVLDFSKVIAQASGGFLPSTAAPILAGVNPNTAPAGSAGLTLTLSGSNFTPGATAYFNGAPLSTTFVSAQQLTAALPTARLTTAGTFPITVANPDAPSVFSAPQSFVVQAVTAPNPVPTISSLSPNSASLGGTSLQVTISGTGFLSSSTVTFNGITHSATFVGTSQLTITLNAADLSTGGSFPVVVTNPTPGGGASNAVNFTICDCAAVPAGTITTVAGTGTASPIGDNGPATSAQLSNPFGVAVDSAGSIYIGDSTNSRVRKVTNGVITTVAGNGTQGYGGDSGPATSAELAYPQGVAVDSAGNVYIADSSNNRIRKVTNGVIATVAGNGTAGFSGDNGPATSAELRGPRGVAVDSAGNIYIADSNNNRIRKVTNGVITTVAGSGTGGGFSGDNGPATSAVLAFPFGVSVDSAGSIHIADTGNNRIRKVTNGVITTVAGNGTAGFSGDNGPATGAQLNDPFGVAEDSAGNIYIADTNNFRIREVTNGVVTTVAGSAKQGWSGDNGPATSAELDTPEGIAVDSAGNIYIADAAAGRIREVASGSSQSGSSQPAITALSPSSATTGSGPMTLTIGGSGFVASCSVTFNGVSHAVTFIGSNQISITLSASDLAAQGSFPVVVTNPGGAASNTVSFTVGAGGLALQGKSFGINGTITLNGKALGFEIAALATSNTSYFVTLDNAYSASSGIIFEESFTSGTASISGNSEVLSGADIAGAGFYYDPNANSGIPLSITFTTLTANFTSSAVGSAVTGSVKFSTSSGTMQGTFTGTLASPGFY